MSLIDAIILDILKKEGRPVEHQDIVEKGIEQLEEMKKLTVPIRTKLQYTRWQAAKLKGSIYKKIAEKIGWEELDKLECQGTLDHFKEFADKYFQPIIKMLNKMNKNDYFKTYAQVVTIYDYLMGNLDIFDTSDPDRIGGKNVHCGVWEDWKTAGILGEGKMNCAGPCFGGLEMVAKMIHPSLHLTGPRDGKELGVPEIGFVKNRCVGDEICEIIVVKEQVAVVKEQVAVVKEEVAR
jgi:hypothetical protein